MTAARSARVALPVASVLRRGDLLVIAFGGKGRQLAEVLGPLTPAGKLPVRKWRANSARWTDRTFIRPDAIRAAGTDAIEYARTLREPPPLPWVGASLKAGELARGACAWPTAHGPGCRCRTEASHA